MIRKIKTNYYCPKQDAGDPSFWVFICEIIQQGCPVSLKYFYKKPVNHKLDLLSKIVIVLQDSVNFPEFEPLTTIIFGESLYIAFWATADFQDFPSVQ